MFISDIMYIKEKERMINPFLKKHDGIDYLYLDQDCSINKVILAKLPVDGIEEDIRGKCAKDVFSTKAIVDYIKDSASELHIDIQSIKENDLCKEVSRWLSCGNNDEKEIARKTVKKFGYRLGLCLLVLKTGLKENKEVRKEWSSKHWEYLSKVKRIILVGGLANGVFGEKLKEYAKEVFEMAKCEPYDILLFPNATHLGVTGCKKLIKEYNVNKVNIIFDFGQTFMKRCIIYNDKKVMLKSIRSKYMECDTTFGADKLHAHIVDVIASTYSEAVKYGEIADELIISIANYTVGGKLNSIRGGYAKLAVMSDNYASYLENELEIKIHKRIKIILVHDGTAMAMNFSDYKDTLCISIGTVFGMGCPDCIREKY